MSGDSSQREGFGRRQFIAAGALAVGGLAAAGRLPALGAQGNLKKRVLHIVGYSHIDAAWLWPETETVEG